MGRCLCVCIQFLSFYDILFFLLWFRFSIIFTLTKNLYLILWCEICKYVSFFVLCGCGIVETVYHVKCHISYECVYILCLGLKMWNLWKWLDFQKANTIHVIQFDSLLVWIWNAGWKFVCIGFSMFLEAKNNFQKVIIFDRWGNSIGRWMDGLSVFQLKITTIT